MYDREWAARVLRTYRESCPRARQIDRCLEELGQTEGYWTRFSSHQIEQALIRAIRDRFYGRVWSHYKKVCTRSPFDRKLALDVCKELGAVWYMEKGDAAQILLEFDLFDETWKTT